MLSEPQLPSIISTCLWATIYHSIVSFVNRIVLYLCYSSLNLPSPLSSLCWSQGELVVFGHVNCSQCCWVSMYFGLENFLNYSIILAKEKLKLNVFGCASNITQWGLNQLSLIAEFKQTPIELFHVNNFANFLCIYIAAVGYSSIKFKCFIWWEWIVRSEHCKTDRTIPVNEQNGRAEMGGTLSKMISFDIHTVMNLQ